jgi:SAM-dependent methyltransferase
MREHEHGEQQFGETAQAAEWDARYRERDGAMWSGRPNGRLVAEVAALTTGRALDVGCGEGADAIWLAQRGWTVTAIDVSEVAIGRAREASHSAGVSVEWICGDVLQTPFLAGSFELVSMQYPALRKAAGEPAVRRLLDMVRPGGLLLAVYHDLDDEHLEHMKSRGVDPTDYVGADDLGRLLGDDFMVELHAVEPRIDPPPGIRHIADVVLRARRRCPRPSTTPTYSDGRAVRVGAERERSEVETPGRRNPDGSHPGRGGQLRAAHWLETDARSLKRKPGA